MQVVRWSCLYLLLGWGLAIGITNAKGIPQPDYKSIYLQADRLSNVAHPTDDTDQKALDKYLLVIRILSSTGADKPFLFKTYVATGAFLQVLDRSSESRAYFKKAFRLKELGASLPDSALFKPLVYCGNSYYQEDELDSAKMMYDRARMLVEKYPHISEAERLYNTLGVIAYRTGNYNKSITYYEKALNTLMALRTVDQTLRLTYTSNLASSYRKLKRYPEALKLYQQVLKYGFETDKLSHNIGAVYLEMGDYGAAIQWLGKVKYQDQKKINDLGKAYLGQKNYQKALFFLEEADQLNKKRKQSQLNSDHGITLKLMGDVYSDMKLYPKALNCYQLALNNFLPDFRSANPYVNPASFNSAFNGVEIMETVLAKATAFEGLFKRGKKVNDLKAALQTYFTFYRLADYTQRFYETDESRILITARKYAVRQLPIAICQQLYALTKEPRYMESAFLLDEENKANTLSIYREESTLKARSGVPAALLDLERTLKENITRASLQASDETDSLQSLKLRRSVNENAVRLMTVQNKINKVSGKKAEGSRISLKAFQQKIPRGSLVLSYHLGEKDILCFVISSDAFRFFQQPYSPSFPADLEQMYQLAKLRSGNTKRTIPAISQRLYRQLIEPAEDLIASHTDLMIIPEDELNYLPFEMLSGDGKRSLLSDYTVSYNYSCSILQNTVPNAGTYSSKLGMAPFSRVRQGNDFHTQGFAALPGSGKELQALGERSVYDEQATKKLFLQNAPGSYIIHLATHAYANDLDPGRSFIAFYPSQPGSPASYKLFLPEIYNLQLNATKLIVLSACESGSGELIRGEGLMSLSRAFAYAGCDNIITSMWKADDASTAYIAARFHHYLQKGDPIARALQKAQLAYLNDSEIDDAKKLPGYWAHLRLIGGFPQQDRPSTFLFFTIGISLLAALIAIISRNRRRRSRL